MFWVRPVRNGGAVVETGGPAVAEWNGPVDASALREMWASAADGGDYGVLHAIVRCEGGKVDTEALRAALERFNEAPEDG